MEEEACCCQRCILPLWLRFWSWTSHLASQTLIILSNENYLLSLFITLFFIFWCHYCCLLHREIDPGPCTFEILLNALLAQFFFLIIKIYISTQEESNETPQHCSIFMELSCGDLLILEFKALKGILWHMFYLVNYLLTPWIIFFRCVHFWKSSLILYAVTFDLLEKAN